MKILGIETSCDETAASVVTSEREILSSIIRSQFDEHMAYGGVVPELASRAHIEHLDDVIKAALEKANTKLEEVDAIAVTAGPGLIGGVIVGVMEAKAMAAALGKPFIAVNHLEAHALTARLSHNIPFPYLLLLVSGGHTQLLKVNGVGDYILLGETLDDAVGESFDKLAKSLGLGIPGGPKIEELAKEGNGNAFELPRPLFGQIGCDFSLSGLKTAVKRKVDSREFSPADVCAVFQKTIGEIIENRVQNAINMLGEKVPNLVVAGGVASNQAIREKLEGVAAKNQMQLIAPPPKLCTDNAAMVAWAGLEKLKRGEKDELNFKPLARWPLAS